MSRKQENIDYANVNFIYLTFTPTNINKINRKENYENLI